MASRQELVFATDPQQIPIQIVGNRNHLAYVTAHVMDFASDSCVSVAP